MKKKNVSISISKLLNIEVSSSFQQLKNILRENILNFSQNKNYDVSFFTPPSLLSELEKILQDSIADFSHRDIVILLDEYHELSFAQQEIISDIISVRRPIFKIATVPAGFTTERSRKNIALDLNQDFQVVELGVRNITPDSDELSALKNFLVEMINKRLKKFKLIYSRFTRIIHIK